MSSKNVESVQTNVKNKLYMNKIFYIDMFYTKGLPK